MYCSCSKFIAVSIIRTTPLAQALADAIPGARLEVIAGAAHLCNIEQAERFSALLLDFLA